MIVPGAQVVAERLLELGCLASLLLSARYRLGRKKRQNQ